MTSTRVSTLTWKDWWPVAFVLLLFGLYLGTLGLHWWPFGALPWDHVAHLGDAFGILTSLFTGLAFGGLIITITLQSRELRLQRLQLEQQAHELRSQRQETERLANAQEAAASWIKEQTLVTSMSALVAFQAFENRSNFAGPPPAFAAIYEHLLARVQRDLAERDAKENHSG